MFGFFKTKPQEPINVTTTVTVNQEPTKEVIKELEPTPVNGIVTTEEELQGYQIVKAICSAVLPSSRIFMRDVKTYCTVLADNNNRKNICRLWFNGKVKYISFTDVDGNQFKHVIECVDDIYKYSDALRKVAKKYV